MEDVNKRRRILSAVFKKSTPGKFAYTCHFQQIGINATKIEKTGIHFKTDVFAAVADAKKNRHKASSLCQASEWYETSKLGPEFQNFCYI